MANGATWVNLDPTLPASEPGTVLAPVSETLDQLPDDLRYQVEFDVLVEGVSGGQLVTDKALTYTGFADELAGTPVTFGHVTPSGLKRLGVSLSNLLGGGWIDYRPTLQVASHSLIADKSVAFPAPGGGSDIFGTEPSASAPAGPIEGETTAEWLEVRVTAPGSKPSVARRTIFDRLPAESRTAGELTPSAVQPIELVDVLGTGSTDFPPMLGIRTFAVATGPTSAAPVAASSGDELGMFALAYHNVRDSMDGEMALDAGARTFIDGPNIVSVSVDVDGIGGAADVRAGLDIWHRSTGILPLTGSSLSVAESQLIAGVTAHIAERFAVEGLATAPKAPLATVGVGDVFEAAARQGIATLVLHGAVPDSMPYGATATGLIKDALASGDVVVVPSTPVMIDGRSRVGWWTIDPSTGLTTDVLDDGSGAELAEEAVIVDTSVGRLICFGSMALAAAAAVAAAAELVGSFGASATYRLFARGVGDTSCGAV